ncbi:MAG: prephenate dehydrogenase/arogenate dehydrogenase family protein, partial [Betaproteobacteria bacterium]|nr:prephenate dehydrogenase/arogenate dehydrogenase family protein [Betaproteobacteria bacterium]
VIDEIGAGYSTVAGAAVVLVAAPVRKMREIFSGIAPYLEADALIIDAGSTKSDVVAAARESLGVATARFVPCHPIAGRERSGVTAADRELFVARQVVITPIAENSAEIVNRATLMWNACGAFTCEMSPGAHDAVFAAVSHLPHLLAFALVDELASRPNAKTLFSHAASGFRDFTRIAGSSPEMWRDIALNNREALIAEMDRYLAHASTLRDAVAQGDAVALETIMFRAREAREKWMAGELDHFNDEAA